MRLVVFNDLHYTRHPPECRADTYAYEVLQKLHEVKAVTQRVKATVIGCTGDWFHRKGRVTFREQNDLLAVINGWQSKGIDVVGILGNHDIAGHSLDSLDNRAVGALVHSKALHLLDHEPYVHEDGDGTVGITGTSYFHGCDANDQARLHMYGSERPIVKGLPRARGSSGRGPRGVDVHVHFAHATLLQKGEFFEDFTVARDLVDLLDEHDLLPDVIVCGHLHFNEGIKVYKVRDRRVAVCRVGSLGRVSKDDLVRQIKVAVIATKGDKFACKAVPIGKPMEQIDQGEDGTGSTVTEHEERIREFVRALREEADEFSIASHTKLLRTVCDELGYSTQVYETALRAVEERQ